MICEICNYESTGKDFSNHLQREHKLKSKEYTAKYIYKEQPMCEHCGNETRYVAYKFKRFCKDCSKIASSVAGREGGKAQAWNKGLTKETDERVKKQAENQTGEMNPFYGKRHTLISRQQMSKTKTLDRIKFQQRISERANDFELLTSFDDYFSRQEQYLEFKCKKCETTSKKTLQTFERGSLCQVCFPNNISQFENEIAAFIESENVEYDTKVRYAISPKELDVYVPTKQVAIEANGLYWHSDNNRVEEYDKRKHINKTKLCLENDISLIHIFSDEWYNKKDICKSLISYRIGTTKNRIFARKCKIAKITKQEEKEFFEKNHISGFTPSKECFALKYKDEIVSTLSVRSPRQQKYKSMLEIARFATLRDTAVVGGLSRLFSYAECFAIENNYSGIMTYADRRFGEGKGYEKIGLTYEGSTGIDYWYTDGRVRINRFIMRTTKNETEKQKAYKNNLMKIHGCGSNIFTKYFQ
jgi:hypothetical protein